LLGEPITRRLVVALAAVSCGIAVINGMRPRVPSAVAAPPRDERARRSARLSS
jgi:hypothetical protein